VLALRQAVISDVPVLLRMLHESAADQGFPEEVVVSKEDLEQDGFGPTPRFHAVLADWDGAPAGMAIYFFNYSTWVSRYGLYLEDLYVDRNYRQRGVAKALMVHLARVAIDEGCGRFQWMVHCENESALQLYKSLGAESIEEWTLMLIEGHGIRRLAGSP
jgi:GNAT superfamily N-acetyltransferase